MAVPDVSTARSMSFMAAACVGVTSIFGARLLALEQDPARARAHAADQVRLERPAAVGEHAVGARELDERHFRGAERERGVRAQRGAYAETAGHGCGSVGPNRHVEARGCGVHRMGERLAQG